MSARPSLQVRDQVRAIGWVGHPHRRHVRARHESLRIADERVERLIGPHEAVAASLDHGGGVLEPGQGSGTPAKDAIQVGPLKVMLARIHRVAGVATQKDARAARRVTFRICAAGDDEQRKEHGAARGDHLVR